MEPISTALNKTLVDSDLKEIGKDAIEASIDHFINDGLLKEIPIVNTVVGVIKTTQNISSFLFLKKIIAFLNGIQETDAKKRYEMIVKINTSGKYRMSVGEKLLYIIDKCDDHEKAEYIALLFVAFLQGKIDYENYLKGAHSINSLFIEDFKNFLSAKDNNSVYTDEASSYIGAGLMFTDIEDVKVNDMEYEGEGIYRKTQDFHVEGGKIRIEYSELGYILRQIFNS